MKIKLIIIYLMFLLPVLAIGQQQVYIDSLIKKEPDKPLIKVIGEALKSCTKPRGCALIFSKRRYDFWPDKAANLDIGLDLQDLKNITIKGNGSAFIFHGSMSVARMVNCENIKMEGFSVDWDRPFISQGQYIQATSEFVDLKINKKEYPFVIENDTLFFVGEGWKNKVDKTYVTLFDKDTKEVLYKTHDGINGDVYVSKAKEIAPNIVRFYHKPEFKPDPGTYVALYSGRYIKLGIEILESKHIILQNIDIYHCLSHGIYGGRSENITLNNVNVKTNDKKGRVFSAVADASHFTNCRGTILVENCAHTGQGDDFINVHGFYSPIVSIENKNTLIVKTTGYNFNREGDEIWLDKKGDTQKGAVRTIKSSRSVKRNEKGSFVELQFSKDLPDALKIGDFVENKTWNARFILRNCRILKKNRARGVLVTTPEDVIIENNYFRTAGAAILIEGDTNYWFESSGNNNVIIRNNTFEDCLTSGSATGGQWEWGEAIITITPNTGKIENGTKPYHKNINIEHNVFKTFDIPILNARSVEGLKFVSNQVKRTYTFPPYAWQKVTFNLDGCRKILITNNHFDKGYQDVSVALQHMKKADLKTDGSFKIN